MAAFAGSSSPLGDLSKAYVGSLLEDFINLGATVSALALVMAVGFGGLIAQRIAGTNAVNAFFYPGTIGVLSLMVAYIVTNIGAIRHLFLGVLRRPLWQLVFPVLGIAFLCFTIYKNVKGTTAPYSHFPWYVLAWLAVGAVFIAAAPHVVRRIGERLTSEIQDGPR